MSSESGSIIPVNEPAQESKDESHLHRVSPSVSPQPIPANRDDSREHKFSHNEMVPGSDFLLLNRQELERVWYQVDSMKTAIEELRSKIEENSTLRVVEKLCESIDKLASKLGSKLESNGQTAESHHQDAHAEKSSTVPSMAELAESKSPRIKHRTSHAKPSAMDKLNNFFEGGIPKDCKFVDLIGFLRKALNKSPLSEEESQTLIIQLEGMFRFQEDKSLELQKECEQAKSQSEILEMEHSKMQSSIKEQEDNLKRQLVSLEEEKLRAERCIYTWAYVY